MLWFYTFVHHSIYYTWRVSRDQVERNFVVNRITHDDDCSIGRTMVNGKPAPAGWLGPSRVILSENNLYWILS